MLLIQHFTKVCSKCNETKYFKDFNTSKRNRDGYVGSCRSCQKQYFYENRDILRLKQKQYRELNKDRIAENKKKWHFNNRDSILKHKREYHHKNKDVINLKSKQFYEKNKDEQLKKRKIYAKTQIGKSVHRNKEHKRRSKTKQGDVTAQQLLELQQNAKVCYWCNASLKNKKVHIDHYVPLSKGGEHTLSNLVVSCDKCNLRKNAKDPIIFANSMGKLF